MDLKGSKTEKHILMAFAGESQARNRYTFAASAAKSEGYVQISKVFEETANQEKEHAERLFKLLKGGELEITAGFPAGVIGTTAENLKAAITGETYEYKEMYPPMVEQAETEDHRAKHMFGMALKAEEVHAQLYQKALEAVEQGNDLTETEFYLCPICGHIEFGSPPDVCPICGAPADRFTQI